MTYKYVIGGSLTFPLFMLNMVFMCSASGREGKTNKHYHEYPTTMTWRINNGK